MARHRRSSKMETRAARMRLGVRKKPHFLAIAPSVILGYRRCKGPGRWIARAKNWSKVFALADDFESSNGVQVLNFYEAQDRCKELVRGHSGGQRPLSVKEALEHYKQDLLSRGSGEMNARRVLIHLDDALGSKSVAQLVPRDLKEWRDNLLANGMKPATAHRTSQMLKAALNLSARDDQRIVNTNAWKTGLPRLPATEAPPSKILSDAVVRDIVRCAYKRDAALGCFVETAATTGARPSQLLRLRVGDLKDGSNPTLMMPSSRKGRRRAITSQPIPISSQLGKALRSHAADRGPGEALFVNSDGQPRRPQDYHRHWQAIASELGLEPAITFYALRHSSIVRQLLASVPIRVVAAHHDSSVSILENTYSKFIVSHSDAVIRGSLLSVT